MIRSVVTCVLFLLISCVSNKEDNQNAVVYLSNYSFDKFDKSFMEVLIDDKLVLSDSVNNRYLSFYWQDSTLKVPERDFNLKIKVNSNGFELAKDTTISYRDSLNVFVTFNFEPYYKRYTHPDIYNYFVGETTRFKEIADSLYSVKALPNAEEYLNDTIPLKSSIKISIK
jgi:hypothetical protein